MKNHLKLLIIQEFVQRIDRSQIQSMLRYSSLKLSLVSDIIAKEKQRRLESLTIQLRRMNLVVFPYKLYACISLMQLVFRSIPQGTSSIEQH